MRDISPPFVTVLPEETIANVEIRTRVRVNDKELNLTLLMQEDELAPLFSGAVWAGTVLWDAALHLTRRFLRDYQSQLEDPSNSLRVLELGAGIGVPGMAARMAGAKDVVLTEQKELVRLLDVNLAANDQVLRVSKGKDGGKIVARPLTWGVHETEAYLTQYKDEKIDLVLACDCIYEPLYGTSWRALAQTMELLCLANPKCLVLLCVERRNADGIDKFLTFIKHETRLESSKVEDNDDEEEEDQDTSNKRLQVYSLALSTAARV